MTEGAGKKSVQRASSPRARAKSVQTKNLTSAVGGQRLATGRHRLKEEVSSSLHAPGPGSPSPRYTDKPGLWLSHCPRGTSGALRASWAEKHVGFCSVASPSVQHCSLAPQLPQSGFCHCSHLIPIQSLFPGSAGPLSAQGTLRLTCRTPTLGGWGLIVSQCRCSVTLFNV